MFVAALVVAVVVAVVVVVVVLVAAGVVVVVVVVAAVAVAFVAFDFSLLYSRSLARTLSRARTNTQRTACAQRSIVWALQEFIVWRIGQQSQQVVREPEHHVSARRCAKDLLRDRSILTSHWLQYFARKEPPSGSVADACRDRQGWISQR